MSLGDKLAAAYQFCKIGAYVSVTKYARTLTTEAKKLAHSELPPLQRLLLSC
jgi:hypothetical protein